MQHRSTTCTASMLRDKFGKNVGRISAPLEYRAAREDKECHVEKGNHHKGKVTISPSTNLF